MKKELRVATIFMVGGQGKATVYLRRTWKNELESEMFEPNKLRTSTRAMAFRLRRTRLYFWFLYHTFKLRRMKLVLQFAQRHVLKVFCLSSNISTKKVFNLQLTNQNPTTEHKVLEFSFWFRLKFNYNMCMFKRIRLKHGLVWPVFETTSSDELAWV